VTVEQMPSPPIRERGYAHLGAGDWWGSVQTEKTPELRWPQCLEVYEDMDDQDGQVGSTLAASDLNLPIAGETEVQPNRRRRGRFSWHQHMAIAVPDHLQFGHAVFEQVYYPPSESPDGLAHLRKLGYRPPRTIAEWDIANDGGLRAITQWAPGVVSPGLGTMAVGPIGTRLPISRLVVYVNRKKGSNWRGRSVLRPAYKNWILKDRFLRIQAQVAERNGMGLPVYEAAGTGSDEIEAGEEITAAARAGDDSGISLPQGAKFSLVGVTGTLPDIMAAVKYHDEQIARSMLANVLNLGQNRGTGSWALGTTLNDVLALAIKAIAENVRDTADEHIIADLVEINYGPDEPAPRLVFDEIGSKNDAIVAAIATLVANGVLKPDENLETFLRTTLGIPPRGGDPIVVDDTADEQEAS
jgi:hypothetical protein